MWPRSLTLILTKKQVMTWKGHRLESFSFCSLVTCRTGPIRDPPETHSGGASGVFSGPGERLSVGTGVDRDELHLKHPSDVVSLDSGCAWLARTESTKQPGTVETLNQVFNLNHTLWQARGCKAMQMSILGIIHQHVQLRTSSAAQQKSRWSSDDGKYLWTLYYEGRQCCSHLWLWIWIFLGYWQS